MVEGRDEGAVEAVRDLVGDDIALVLDFLDLLADVRRTCGLDDQLHEQISSLHDVSRLLAEQLEETFFPRDEAQSHSS